MKPLRLTSLVVFGGNGNNSSGFTGLPAGNHYSEGTFKYIGTNGYFWSSTEKK